MNDIVAIQYALFHGLRSVTTFRNTNIVLGREYLSAKVAQDAVWQVPSPGGKTGVGLIVQIPSLRFPKANSVQRVREFSVGIYENPDMNRDPDIGTITGAEDWGDLVIDFLWNWRLWRASGLILEDKAIVPDTRFEGIVGVRAIATLRQERQPVERVATPVITDDGAQNVTLTCSTAGADIYYTTDGFSTPAPTNDGSLPGETAAIKYAAPFAVAPGATVLAIAWQDGVNPSQSAQSTIS